MDAAGIFFSEFFAIGIVIAIAAMLIWAVRDMTRAAIALVKVVSDPKVDKDHRKLHALELLAWTYWLLGIVTAIIQQPAWATLLGGGIVLSTMTVIRGRQLRKQEEKNRSLAWISS